ncbi:uncharacterized protein Triagg1_3378 [Trichoderma aggressivum f. europaeum]|uniref:Uncharacterized protein n=1 Tax=Trichoderma aggressivum f. europaeum TaxID=173218 RepID=A0AAE1IHZ5_9HYPO|nr:hypothetical protein Triagg1_3378 [Trichoderma aggressivum f. europaeum]
MAKVVSSKALECQAYHLPSITIQADGETPATPTCRCSLRRNPEEGEFENSDDAQISKKQSILHQNDAPSPGLSPFASIRPPEPSSINDILRQHCRESLYVKPLYWTLHHLELLGCQFYAKIEKEENARHAENAGSFQGHSQGQPGDQVPNTTKLPPDTIIRRAGFSSTLKFYFNSRHVNSLSTYGTFLHTLYKSDGPRLAFLSLRDVGVRRNMSIRLRHVRRSSPEYRALQKKRDQVWPVNEVEDPYVAAVLIALAQKQQRQQHTAAVTQADTLNRGDASDGETKAYEVFLMAHSAMDKPCLYFYTARIPSSFLGRLDNPSLNIPSRPFRIKYHQISFSSIDAMKEDLKFAISVIYGEEYVF